METVEGQIGVCTCLDIVCQAFKDGGAIIEKVKNKRSQKKAPPPPRLLEESIDAAPDEIEKEKHRGIARFGKTFEEGDVKTIITLQYIALQLQGSLLAKLRESAFDDDSKITDFTHLIDVVDSARDRTIATIEEFKHRLILGDITPPATHQQTSTANSSASNLELAPKKNALTLIRSSHESTPPGASARPSHHRTWTRDYNVTSDEDATSGHEEAHHAHHRKRTSLLHFLRHTRTNSAGDVKLPVTPENTLVRMASTSPSQSQHGSIIQDDATDRSTSYDSNQYSPELSTSQGWSDGQGDMWTRKPSTERRDTVVAPEMASSTPNLPLQAPAMNRARTNTNLNTSYTNNIPVPTPDNDYLGLCKGAWKLQNGDRRGMQKCREGDPWSMHGSAGPVKQYLSCTTPKCSFKSNIHNQDADLIWDKVFSVSGGGMKFRWRFMAKSHIFHKATSKGEYHFKCLFCIFLAAKTATAVYVGIEPLTEHLAEHRGQTMSDVILYKAGCINDHVARIDEDFDINLYPLTTDERRDTEVATKAGADDIFRPRSRQPHDSFIEPEERWNEGLSNFHYDGGMDPDQLPTAPDSGL